MGNKETHKWVIFLCSTPFSTPAFFFCNAMHVSHPPSPFCLSLHDFLHAFIAEPPSLQRARSNESSGEKRYWSAERQRRARHFRAVRGSGVTPGSAHLGLTLRRAASRLRLSLHMEKDPNARGLSSVLKQKIQMDSEVPFEIIKTTWSAASRHWGTLKCYKSY